MLSVLNVLQKLNIDDKHLILSVSGGVDSMSLLSYLNNKTNYNLVVVHFNHLTRKENIDEERLVKGYCDENKIPFYRFKLKIKTGNFQSKAREKRLSLLKQIAIKYSSPYILTAHHLDDLIETILMRAYRGNHVLSLYGFEKISNEENFTFVKPFLTVEKSAIESYAKTSNTKFIEDPTNLENIYFRNRIRNIVIPQLKKDNPDFNDKMLNIYYFLLNLKESIRKETLLFLNKNETINLKDFSYLDNLVKEDIITYLLNNKKISSSSSKLQKIFKAILNSKPNLTIPITSNYNFIKSYDKGYIDYNRKPIFEAKQLKLDQIIKINNDFSIIYTKKKPKNTNNWSVLWYNDLMMPMCVRQRKNGDKLAFHYGTKKLKDFFIDEKIPIQERESSLIVTDRDDNILWIPFLYLNQTLGNKNKLFLKIISNNQKEDNHEQ